MKPAKFAALAITSILFTGIGCSKQDDKTASIPEPVAKPQAADTQLNNVVQDNSGKTVLYWYDPMAPNQKFAKPGKSPVMDMQLIPKYADGADERSQP